MKGLCESCEHRREIVNDRGSRFTLCQKAKDDPRLPKYPRLPVLRCAAHTPRVETLSGAE